MRTVLVSLILLSSSLAFATEKPSYETAQLIDMNSVPTGGGKARAQYSFCLAVQAGDTAYLLNYWPTWSHSYQPTDLVVGDAVQVRLDGKRMYVQKSKGAEFKTSILRRERVSPDHAPTKCGQEVSLRP